MYPEDQEDPADLIVARTWQVTLFLGVVTVILGLIVSFRPSGSLNVIAVLLGILMIISGIFHLIRVFDRAEQHRIWLGIAGLLYVVIGVVLIRHLHLTVALIGLIVGITWIIQGLSALFGGVAGSREGRGWWIFFGIVSLIAGIVVVVGSGLVRHRARRPAGDLVHRHGPVRGRRGLHHPTGRLGSDSAAAVG